MDGSVATLPVVPRSSRLLRMASDERLVALVRAGHESAFEAIYDRHHRAILSFCRHMVASREEAEDAVQQTFLSAYRDLNRSDKPIQLKAWLFTIARNRCLSILRARREQVSIDDVEPATEGLTAQVERRADLQEMLADLVRLPDDQREALVLSELGALDHDEIAGVVGCPKAKVKALVFQARSSLAASREARETSCEEIREQLSTLTGGALRRSPLRRHLRECAGCREFQDEVKRQKRAMAVLLPVVPTVALKKSVLAGMGFGGGGAAGGGLVVGGGLSAATAGGLGALGGGGLIIKSMIVAAGISGAAAGGVALVHQGEAAKPAGGSLLRASSSSSASPRHSAASSGASRSGPKSGATFPSSSAGGAFALGGSTPGTTLGPADHGEKVAGRRDGAGAGRPLHDRGTHRRAQRGSAGPGSPVSPTSTSTPTPATVAPTSPVSTQSPGVERRQVRHHSGRHGNGDGHGLRRGRNGTQPGHNKASGEHRATAKPIPAPVPVQPRAHGR